MRSGWIPLVDNILFKYPDAGRHASVYFVRDKDFVCLIDPSVDERHLPEGVVPDMLLLTHAHSDHFWAIDEYRDAMAIPLYLHEADAATLADPLLNGSVLFGRPLVPAPASHLFGDGDSIALGDTLTLKVIHTPGHTPGSSCLLLEQTDGQKPLALITGDTLFPGSIGRTDLAGGDQAQMAESLRALKTLLKSLPADLVLLAGHGPASMCGRELQYNPFLNAPHD
jgi:glyoxylase-like metal-dependent hydrolase (beta-lactamase superfamily II)